MCEEGKSRARALNYGERRREAGLKA